MIIQTTVIRLCYGSRYLGFAMNQGTGQQKTDKFRQFRFCIGYYKANAGVLLKYKFKNQLTVKLTQTCINSAYILKVTAVT